MTIQQTISASIRGLTYRGSCGHLVRCVSESGEPNTAGTPVRFSPSAESIETGTLTDTELHELSAAVAGASAGDTQPRTIEVPGVGRVVVAPRLRPEAPAGAESPRSGLAAAMAGDRNAVVAGRVAVVTGGAQGFGAEIVRALAAAGAVVVVADLNLEGAERFAATIRNEFASDSALAVGVDVSDEASVAAMVATISEKLGGIDLFVSNAGVLKAGSVKELSLDDFEFVTRVNYRGFFLCTKYVSPVMAAQFRASGVNRYEEDLPYYTDIIQINSKSGLEGSNRNGAYAGAKFGGIGLVQSFAMELVTDGVKVNAICPGNFFEGPLWADPDRGLFVQYLRAGKVPGAQSVADVKRFYEQKVPMGRGCRGADVARAILYAVEQKYETGQAIPVTGGQVMLR